MKNKWNKYTICLFVLFALGMAEPPRCGSPIPTASVSEFPPAIVILQGKTPQGYPYLSGGISSDERDAMVTLGRDYSVKLIFADKSGAYLSYVRLYIQSAKGEDIVSLDATGPWFCIQLPPGTYRVKATVEGQSQGLAGLRVVKDKKTQQLFVWDLGG